MSSELIKVDCLAKFYRTYNFQVKAIEGISFSLPEGSFLSIVGPSGAGKSTLLHSLGGILTPDRGEVFYRGKSIYRQKESKLAAWRNKNIGFVFQFYYLIEELNVLENIALAAFRLNKKDSFQRAGQLLEYLDLEERALFYPSQLSGGQKQKVAIARALVNKPAVLLCDEPTGNLDQAAQEKIEKLLDKINREENTTIILVTHNLRLAEAAKRIIFIEGGRLSQQ